MKTKNNPEEHLKRAMSLLKTSPVLAEACLKRNLTKFPEHMATLQILGVIQHNLGKDKEAEVNFRKLIKLDPSNAENYANLGTALGGQNRHAEAILAMKKSVEISPNPMFLNNLAIQYQKIDEYELAENCFTKALGMKQSSKIWDNLGSLYVKMELYEKAKSCYLKAISMDEHYMQPHIHLGLTYHFMGDWKKGFEKYEWRFLYYPELCPYVSWYDLSKSWDGKVSLKGKRVLIYGEQGIGDIIMFSRYVKKIKEMGAYVMFHIPESLNKLFEWVDEVVNVDINHLGIKALPDYDYQFALMSAPYLLGVDRINGDPYINDVPDDFRKSMKEKHPSTMNIGIVWSGNNSNPDNAERMIPLKELLKIEKTKGVKLFSLQVGGEESAKNNIEDLAVHVNDFYDTARVLKGLDLLICCDTSVAHIAGAIGLPVWNLIRYGPDWRWPFRNVSETHWYKSMKLFHQRKKNDWSTVMDDVLQELVLLGLELKP